MLQNKNDGTIYIFIKSYKITFEIIKNLLRWEHNKRIKFNN